MNLIDKYKSPIAYENIKVGDTLIVTGCYDPDEYYCNEEPDVGDVVKVISVMTCDENFAANVCEIAPCKNRRVGITVENTGGLTCTSCFYSFTTIDGRTIR